MAGLAGSGGYWISAPADFVFAQPGTITGSIGVVSGKLARGEAWRNLGVEFGLVKAGRNATTWDPTEPFSDTERERNEAFLDWIYDDFINHVATGRSMATEAVRSMAKGRVWTGEKAKELGLIDELGGLRDAVGKASSLAGLAPDERLELVAYPRQKGMRLLVRKENSEPVEVAATEMLRAIQSLEAIAPSGHSLSMPDQFWRQ